MDNKKEFPASWKHSMTAVAGYMAIIIGVAWSASFLCSMYGMQHVWLSSLGNLIALYSIYLVYSNVRSYRSWIRDISFPLCWLLAFYICIFATLITSAVQYAYFEFLDNGRLMDTMLKVTALPEYQQTIKQMLPGMELKEITALIEGLTVRNIMAELITFNFILSVFISLFAGLLGSMGKVKKDETVTFFDDEK